MMAAQEFEGMKEQLDLEQSLRVKAETYAHEVMKESQKPAAPCMQQGAVHRHVEEEIQTAELRFMHLW